MRIRDRATRHEEVALVPREPEKENQISVEPTSSSDPDNNSDDQSLRSSFDELWKLAKQYLLSTVGRNVLSLYGVQIANYVLPLITIPYLVRVLGPDKFGLVSFGQGLIAYLVLLVEYGFELSATRTISLKRDDIEDVSEVAGAVWVAKTLLSVVGFGVLLFAGETTTRIGSNMTLFVALYGIVVGHVFFPIWLFQGLEKMEVMSAINAGVRVFSTASIFLLVNQPSDYIVYAIILSAQWILAGVVAIAICKRVLGISFVIPSVQSVVRVYKNGWMLFLSNGAVSLYTAGNSFILGLLASNATVGYYSGAEKFIKALRRMLNPIRQALYPRFSQMASKARDELQRWVRRGLWLQGGIGLVLSIGIFVAAPYAVDIVLGDGYEPSVSILRVLSPVPFLVAVNSSFDQFVLLPFEMDATRLYVLTAAGISNIIGAALLVPVFEGAGMAASVMTVEFGVTLTYFLYLRWKGLSPV